MEQLASCYFCGGALDASLDEYPVVPKELHPSPDDQRSVVLCQGCRQKLGTIIETVVGAVDDESDGSGTEWISADSLADDDESSTDRNSSDSLAESDDGQRREEPDKQTTGTRDESSTRDGQSPAGKSDTGQKSDTYSTGTSAGGRKTESADDGKPSLTALENTKVMRLLQNREFPVDRAEIRTVAVNAYEIDESEFDTVVDAAVDRGLIAEENGQFVDTA